MRRLRKRVRFSRLGAMAWLLAMLLATTTSDRPMAQATALAGATTTVLPNGLELIVGGLRDGSPVATVVLRNSRTGAAVALPSLATKRVGHSATLLPDGSVLVLGGTDERSRRVSTAERIFTDTGEVESLSALKWNGRAGHSATLIDGEHLVVIGGNAQNGPSDRVERITLSDWGVQRIGTLPRPRLLHQATLLADGRIEVWGGQDTDGVAADSGAVVDPWSGGSVESVSAEPAASFTSIAGSEPTDLAINVGLQPHISVRLSRPVLVASVNATTVSLTGPSGAVPSRVLAAEQGRLLLITPNEPLEPATTYFVALAAVRDVAAATVVPYLTVTFTTAPDGSGVDSLDGLHWDPLDARSTNWRTNRPPSPWQRLQPLRAKPGITALSGQVLRLDGSPLPHVELELEGHVTKTDGTGRFLLEAPGEPTGWGELWIDGRPARSRGAVYGTFEAAVHLTGNTTEVLPFTIWMPAIDTAHAVTIPSPTGQQTVITTPSIPGLELHLPAGAVIRQHDGAIAKEVSITPIPLDRPPFPLPAGVDVPIYFTIQPGGSYVEVPGATGYTRGARLIYPNYKGRPAGTPMEFWHYDPEEGRGWYVYGRGAISADGRQAVPEARVSFHEFTGAMVAPPTLGPAIGRAPGIPGFGSDGDPVDLSTGLFIQTNTDLSLPDVLPIAFTRTYRQNDSVSRSFGIGSMHPYDMFLVGTTFPYTYVDLILQDGTRVHYDRTSPGTSFSDAVYEHTSSSTRFYKSTIAWNHNNGWDLNLTDGSKIVFREGFNAVRPAQAAATRIEDRYHNTITLTRDSSSGDLTKITSPNNRWIELTYDPSHRVTLARDNMNRTVQYQYDASGRLWKVTDVLGGITEYTYDAAHRMLTVKDPRNIVYLTNEYDAGGRVSKQTQADNSTYLFSYQVDVAGKITQTEVTNPRGFVRRMQFSSSGYPTSDVKALGQSVQQTTTIEWQSGTNFLTAMVDPFARRTEYAYDGFANTTSMTRLAGTANAVTTTFTYEPTFHQLASVTDPLSHQTLFEYDASGSLAKVRDPLLHETTLVSNSAGQMISVTDALAHTSSFEYDGGDLVRVTDPLGRSSTRFVDAGGRELSVTNPAGASTQYEYNAQNRMTKMIDPLGAQTILTYDPNGRLLTVVDAKNGTTTYTYNAMDRLATRVDALTRSESYAYDANGNLQQVTDRKGHVTSNTYDPLDRVLTTTYQDSSTTTYTYDAGDRLTQITDSLAGTITRGYDLLDRLTSETTPEGVVSYTWDGAGRRTTMTVAGQSPVSYGYDVASRLTSVTQGASVVSMAYDDANRRISLTLPNGVVVGSSYDVASQLTGLTYTLAGSTLGNLTYSYDVAGNRSSVGGTWARTGLPAATPTASYDAANQISTWNGTSFTYDAGGNLTFDGTNTYTWNSRNQLASLAGPVNATFEYDGVGRRRAKTVAGVATGFLYDGLNLAQELSAGSPSANFLSGLSLDEVFTRTDASGSAHLLTDALGSTVALSDSSGAVSTSYTFQPFGATTRAGAATANSVEFAGRENDGTGLYFLRGRYFSPSLQRFMSEDPIGFSGGDPNLYSYVDNQPTMFVDPFGYIKGERGLEGNPTAGMPGGRTATKHTPVAEIEAALKEAKSLNWSKEALRELRGMKKIAQRFQSALKKAGGGVAGGVVVSVFLDQVVLESSECPMGPNTCTVRDPAKEGGKGGDSGDGGTSGTGGSSGGGARSGGGASGGGGSPGGWGAGRK